MEFISSIWRITCELSPWLLVGMALSGMLHVLLPFGFARKNLRGVWGVVKSVAIGVPLPLCSCGVIPAGLGLKKDGASTGAAVAFLISTPQTGVDSVLVSASFFGLPFAIFKLVSAAVMGVLGGLMTDQFNQLLVADGGNCPSCCPAESALPVIQRDQRHRSNVRSPVIGRMFFAHSIDMLRSIWVWLVAGIFVSALIDQFPLTPIVNQLNHAGLPATMLLVLVLSIPLYVCATASVPIAASLVAAGFPSAVALVFLMAGPATNVTTIGAIRSTLGNRALAVYLFTIVIGSTSCALMFDWLIASPIASHVRGTHLHDHSAWWSALSGVIVWGLILWFAFKRAQRFFGTTAAHAVGK